LSKVTALVAVTFLVASCSGQQSRLGFYANQTAALNLTVSNMAAHQPYSFGSIMLCVDPPAPAVITSVSVDHPVGGVRVDAFGVRPNPFLRGQQGLGGDRSTLPLFSPDFLPGQQQRVSGKCPGSPGSSDNSDFSGLSELAVQVSWDGNGAYSGGHALDVEYEISGQKQDLIIPFGIWLCSGTCPDSLNDAAASSP
jgi:hypothetical protein